MVARVNSLVVPGLKLQPELAAYEAKSLQDQLEQHIEQFVAEIHPNADVVDVLRADLAQNRETLQLALKELLDLIPSEIVVVSDTRSAFEDDVLMKRMIGSLQAIDAVSKAVDKKEGAK